MSATHHFKKTLILSVGSAAATAGYVHENKEGVPTLEHVVRVPIGTGTEASRDALLKNTQAALAQLLQKLAQDPPKEVKVVLGAPWYDARIRTISSKTDTAVAITHKTVERAVRQYQDEKPPVSGNVDVEAAAMTVFVNGYPTALKKPVHGSQLEVNFYESEIPATVEEHVRSAVHTAFPHATLTYNTLPLVSAVSLREVAYAHAFIAVYFSGEMTEVTFVHDNGVRHLATFPIGFYTVARAMSQGADGGVGDTLSRLSLFGREELRQEDMTAINAALDAEFAKWNEALAAALAEVAEQVPVPRRTFIIADAGVVPWFVKKMKEQNPNGFAVEPVSAPVVQGHVALGEEGTYDIFLSLAALFFRSGKDDVVNAA